MKFTFQLGSAVAVTAGIYLVLIDPLIPKDHPISISTLYVSILNGLFWGYWAAKIGGFLYDIVIGRKK